MTQENPGGAAGRAAVVSRQRRVGIVWLIPLVAAAVGAWLAFDAISSRGPTITVTFETAAGLVAGKTKVKYNGVEIGSVTSVAVSDDLSHVVVKCLMLKDSTPYLTEGHEFWVVRPRIGAGGVSGLGTLVSGAYIGTRPGPKDAKPMRAFKGLETPPVATEDAPGLQLVLHAEKTRGLDVGSPVLYRQIQVGQVEGHQLADDGKSVQVAVFIKLEYEHLVQTNSRFWNASGVDVSVGMGGVNVETESFAALLEGGIAFDTPDGGSSDPPKADTPFWLHASHAEVEEAPFRYGGLALVVEAPELGGLKVGDRVYYREEPVGAVVAHALSSDRRTVRIHLNVQNGYASLIRTNTVFWNASGISADLGLKGLHVHTESLESLLSGGVAFATPDALGAPVKAGSVFDLHPEVKDEWLNWTPGKPKKEHKGVLSRVFHHHESKSEKQAAADHDPAQPEPAKSHKHGFFHKVFHGGD